MDCPRDCVVPSPDKPAALNIEMDGKRPRNKPRKPYSFTIKRPKLSWSMTDLSGMYSGKAAVSPPRPSHAPRENINGLRLLDRCIGRSGQSRSSKQCKVPPSPPALSLDEECQKFLEEKKNEQERKRTAIPRARSVFGDPGFPLIPTDVSMEAHVDYPVCAASEEETAYWKARREEWNADKIRGVHFPSVLKIRRKKFQVMLQEALDANRNINAEPARRARTIAVVAYKCKNCAAPEIVIPPGLKPADWLPLVYLRRAQRCEYQRPSMEGVEMARAIVLNRIMQNHAPCFASRTFRRNKCFIPKASPLSNQITPSSFLASANGSLVNEAKRMNMSASAIRVRVGQITEDAVSLSDSDSDYSDDGSNPRKCHLTVASPVYQPVEVPGLQWVKKYRVPKFLPTNTDHHKSLIAEVGPESKVATEPIEFSPEIKYDFNKPLPPLPLYAPPRSPPPCNSLHGRNLRRSHSAYPTMSSNQRSMRLRTQEQTRQ